MSSVLLAKIGSTSYSTVGHYLIVHWRILLCFLWMTTISPWYHIRRIFFTNYFSSYFYSNCVFVEHSLHKYISQIAISAIMVAFIAFMLYDSHECTYLSCVIKVFTFDIKGLNCFLNILILINFFIKIIINFWNVVSRNRNVGNEVKEFSFHFYTQYKIRIVNE